MGGMKQGAVGGAYVGSLTGKWQFQIQYSGI